MSRSSTPAARSRSSTAASAAELADSASAAVAPVVVTPIDSVAMSGETSVMPSPVTSAWRRGFRQGGRRRQRQQRGQRQGENGKGSVQHQSLLALNCDFIGLDARRKGKLGAVTALFLSFGRFLLYKGANLSGCVFAPRLSMLDPRNETKFCPEFH